MGEIKRYLNAIYQPKLITKDDEVIFCGDGEGDFEQRSNRATIEVLTEYITYCQQQIQLAKDNLIKLYKIPKGIHCYDAIYFGYENESLEARVCPFYKSISKDPLLGICTLKKKNVNIKDMLKLCEIKYKKES